MGQWAGARTWVGPEPLNPLVLPSLVNLFPALGVSGVFALVPV